MTSLWPWLLLAGLGAFHGLNPAMGWLFAVALGLHRKRRAAVLLALPIIALGYAVSIGLVAGAVVAAGVVIDGRWLQMAGGILLIAWAIYHQLYGHRHRVRIGMTTGQAGLAAWSFLMATAHGAGLMILPALMPLCLADSPADDVAVADSVGIALAAVGVHTAALLAVAGATAVAVYDWVGLAMLRSAWINLDLIWTLALAAAGAPLLLLS
jgi:hypothetical protein